MNKINHSDIEQLHSLIHKAEDIALVTHINPDGDAVGSTVGMYGFLRGIGKKVSIVYPHRLPDALQFLMTDEVRSCVTIHEDEPEKAMKVLSDADLIFCMDLNSFGRTGDMPARALHDSDAAKVLIDHHLDPDRESFTLTFSETEISSTAEYLYYILMEMPETGGDVHRLPSLTARACMTGMTTDTNNFANSVYPSTFRMASALLEAGVDRNELLSHLFNSYREERLRLMGDLLYRKMKITEDGVAYMVLDRKTIMKYGIKDGETEGFVNLPLSIDKVRLSIFLKEDKEKFRVSVRSKAGVSANRFAAEYANGGGHELASGGRLSIPDNVTDAKDAERYIRKAADEFMGSGRQTGHKDQ